LIIFSDSRDLN